MASGQPAMQTSLLRVSIHCHGCKKKVRKVLKSIQGVEDVEVDAQQHKVMVTGTVDAETLVKRLYKSGKQALPWQHTLAAPASTTEAPAPTPLAEDSSMADKKPAEPVKEPQADSLDKKPEHETAPEKTPETEKEAESEKQAEKEEAKPSDEAKKDGEPKAEDKKEAGDNEGEAKEKQSRRNMQAMRQRKTAARPRRQRPRVNPLPPQRRMVRPSRNRASPRTHLRRTGPYLRPRRRRTRTRNSTRTARHSR